MFLIGLTGGIASGKSTVSSIIREQHHCVVIDADVTAREVVEPGKRAYKNITKEFGSNVIKDDGTIDRAKLGDIVFSDVTKRKRLNAITHPEIAKAMLWKIWKAFIGGEKFVVLDVPLLFETKKWLQMTSYNVVVYCDETKQLQRLMKRDNMMSEDAIKRIKSQMPLGEKKLMASHVIENNGSIEETKQQIAIVMSLFKKSRKYYKIRILAGVTVMIFVYFTYHIYNSLFKLL